LVRNGWDCPEAVELSEWIKILRQYSSELIPTTKRRNEMFDILCELRHSAVHRLRKTAGGVECLAENAQLFLEALNDTYRSERVSMVRRELNMAIEELKRNKDLPEGRYLAELKEIQAKRAALDTREQDAKKAMADGDLQCLNDIDKSLDKVFQLLNPVGPVEEGGKGERPVEYPDISDSEDEYFETVVAVNNNDCQSKHM
jgi:hypothetical protein